MKYKVKIEVIQSTIETIEANSKEEAEELAWDKVDNQELFFEPNYPDYKVTVVENVKKSYSNKKSIKENNNNNWPALDAARYYLNKDYTDEEVWKELDEKGCNDEYIQNVIDYMNELFDEYEEEPFGSPYGHIW